MKNPNVVRFVGLGVVIIMLVAFGIFFFSSSKKSDPVPLQQNVPVETKKSPSLTTKTYVDDAGFQFDYPDDLTVAKKDNTSSVTYSSLEIVSKEVSGSMFFLVEDTKAKSVDELVEKNTTTKEAALGSLEAIEVTGGDKTTLFAIDQGILFQVTLYRATDKSYWDGVYQTIISSFSFVAPAASSQSSSDSDNNDVVQEEDIIE
ncbi:MAG: hypothetical protein HYV37_01590 [Candidatus Levyibacteriota bacterium]|nr:MAG: hypothetical protein HYV37_01590 [Candidatus Levybacteria bacterium]